MAVISPEVAHSPVRPPGRFSIAGLFGRDRTADTAPAEKPKPPELPEFTTEPDAVEHFFKLQGQDARAIATLSFIKQSQETYNSAWLTRELVQNFVDHNPQAPGTLNGVRFEEQTLPNGGKRFVIIGNWPFVDNTGVVTLHSDKPEGINTAGGNGIGLKQAAIRLMRDFGVSKFQIQGEGWTADYQVARAADVNQKWQSMPNLSPIPTSLLKNDWLMVHVQKMTPTGTCSYVIETANPEMIQALQQFPTLGVSSENPYLKDMDFRNQYGAIKWLPKTPDSKLTSGRLFINGQVMNFKNKGKDATNYWVGPEGVTIVLNNQKYEMSVDRPPIIPYILEMDLAKLVKGMSAQGAWEQLQRSEHIWAGYKPKGYFDREGADVVIGVIVNGLSHNPNYNRADFEKYFPGKKYLANDGTASDKELRELQDQGYILCPDYFASIGMSRLSSKLAPKEATPVSYQPPRLDSTERTRITQEIGLEVGYEELPDFDNPDAFFNLLRDRLAANATGISNPQNPNLFKIKLTNSIPEELLFHALPKPRTDQQKYLYFLRGAATLGLTKHLFKRVFYHQADFITTFATEFDEVTREYNLTVRNSKNKDHDESVYLELELNPDYADRFKAVWERTLAQATQTPGADLATTVNQGQIPAPATLAGTAITPREAGPAQKEWTPEEDKLAIQKRADLRTRMSEVPIVHAAEPEREFHGQIIPKQATLSDPEKIRLAQMEQYLPGIVEATNKLDELIPSVSPQVSTGAGEIGKYLDWRDSSGYYGRIADLSAAAGYITGKHLLDLVNEYSQAEIDVVEAHREKSPTEQTLVTLKEKLQNVVTRMVPKEDNVEEFDLVYDPTPAQLRQLGLLRIYTRVVTGVELPNDLFIYRGTGSKGINLGKKAIGVHEALFRTQFSETLETFAHEVAHNQDMTHLNSDWYQTFGALLVKTVSRVSEIAQKDPLQRTQEEKSIISISEIWDRLRTQEAISPTALPPIPPALGS